MCCVVSLFWDSRWHTFKTQLASEVTLYTTPNDVCTALTACRSLACLLGLARFEHSFFARKMEIFAEYLYEKSSHVFGHEKNLDGDRCGGHALDSNGVSRIFG